LYIIKEYRGGGDLSAITLKHKGPIPEDASLGFYKLFNIAIIPPGTQGVGGVGAQVVSIMMARNGGLRYYSAT
jgi:hypothetical protein